MTRYALLISIVWLLGCEKDNRQRFNTSLNVSLDIPAGLNLIETHVFIINNIDPLLASSLQTNGFTTEDIDEINGYQCDITTPFYSGNFNFIEDMSIRIYNDDRSNFKEMFYQDPIPFNEKSPLRLSNGLANLTSVLTKPNFDMEIRIKFRSFVPSDIRAEFDMTYRTYIKE